MKQDCMNTKTFFKERQRMCKYHSFAETGDYCRSEDGALCPLNNGENENCNDMSWEDPIREIAIVQMWSDDHPAETIEQYFNRILPGLSFDYYSDICCKKLDCTLSDPPDGCECDEASCRECWQRPYEK